jgi:hypothetical protein
MDRSSVHGGVPQSCRRGLRVSFVPASVQKAIDRVLEARENAFDLVPVVQARSYDLAITLLERDPSIWQGKHRKGSHVTSELQRFREDLVSSHALTECKNRDGIELRDTAGSARITFASAAVRVSLL